MTQSDYCAKHYNEPWVGINTHDDVHTHNQQTLDIASRVERDFFPEHVRRWTLKRWNCLEVCHRQGRGCSTTHLMLNLVWWSPVLAGAISLVDISVGRHLASFFVLFCFQSWPSGGVLPAFPWSGAYPNSTDMQEAITRRWLAAHFRSNSPTSEPFLVVFSGFFFPRLERLVMIPMSQSIRDLWQPVLLLLHLLIDGRGQMALTVRHVSFHAAHNQMQQLEMSWKHLYEEKSLAGIYNRSYTNKNLKFQWTPVLMFPNG